MPTGCCLCAAPDIQKRKAGALQLPVYLLQHHAYDPFLIHLANEQRPAKGPNFPPVLSQMGCVIELAIMPCGNRTAAFVRVLSSSVGFLFSGLPPTRPCSRPDWLDARKTCLPARDTTGWCPPNRPGYPLRANALSGRNLARSANETHLPKAPVYSPPKESIS